MAGQPWRGKNQFSELPRTSSAKQVREKEGAYRKDTDGVDSLLIDLAVTHFD